MSRYVEHECEKMRESLELVRKTPYISHRPKFPRILLGFIPNGMWNADDNWDIPDKHKHVPKPEGRPYLFYQFCYGHYETPINFCPFCGIDLRKDSG